MYDGERVCEWECDVLNERVVISIFEHECNHLAFTYTKRKRLWHSLNARQQVADDVRVVKRGRERD